MDYGDFSPIVLSIGLCLHLTTRKAHSTLFTAQVYSNVETSLHRIKEFFKDQHNSLKLFSFLGMKCLWTVSVELNPMLNFGCCYFAVQGLEDLLVLGYLPCTHGKVTLVSTVTQWLPFLTESGPSVSSWYHLLGSVWSE